MSNKTMFLLFFAVLLSFLAGSFVGLQAAKSDHHDVVQPDTTLTVDSNRTEFVIRDVDGNEVARFNMFDKPVTFTIKRNK